MASRLVRVQTRLTLPAVKRAVGVLDGRHRSLLKGRGMDFDDMSLYAPGDDVSDIDWKCSARAGIPVIRRFQRETNTSVVLAVDTGRAMAAAAPSGEAKGDIALHAAGIIAYITQLAGDQLGLVAGDAERLRHYPARSGREHVELILKVVDDALAATAPVSDLSVVLTRLLGTISRRSLVIILTDEAKPHGEEVAALGRLRLRHDLLVIAIRDVNPFADDIAEVQDIEDPWDLPEHLRQSDRLRREAVAAGDAQRAAAASALRTLGIPQVTIGASDEALGALTILLERGRHGHR